MWCRVGDFVSSSCHSVFVARTTDARMDVWDGVMTDDVMLAAVAPVAGQHIYCHAMHAGVP